MSEARRVALTLARVVAVGFALTMAGWAVYLAQKGSGREGHAEQPLESVTDEVAAPGDPALEEVVADPPTSSPEDDGDETLMFTSKSADAILVTGDLAEKWGWSADVVSKIREKEALDAAEAERDATGETRVDSKSPESDPPRVGVDS